MNELAPKPVRALFQAFDDPPAAVAAAAAPRVMLDENDPADLSLLMRSLTFPGGIVASDAMPLTWAAGRPSSPSWPLAGRAMTHPRTAGTFGRALRLLTRDGGGLGLADALARCSLEPARLLEDRAPAMRGKGRLRAGSDADIVVFDPEAISDRASYRDSTRPSAGIRHVLVGGTFVVRDGDLVTDARPGRPVRALRRSTALLRPSTARGLSTVRGRGAGHTNTARRCGKVFPSRSHLCSNSGRGSNTRANPHASEGDCDGREIRNFYR
jgi:hypothetical protein